MDIFFYCSLEPSSSSLVNSSLLSSALESSLDDSDSSDSSDSTSDSLDTSVDSLFDSSEGFSGALSLVSTSLSVSEEALVPNICSSKVFASLIRFDASISVSYTHLTLPTNREV